MENPALVTVSVYSHGSLRNRGGVSATVTVSDYLLCLAISVFLSDAQQFLLCNSKWFLSNTVLADPVYQLRHTVPVWIKEQEPYMLMMKRSRAVTKPALIADQSRHQSRPEHKCVRIIQSLFSSPKFRDFTSKCLSGAEALRIPTSILDSMLLPPSGTFSTRISSEKKSSWNKIYSRGIGLALVDALKDEEAAENSDKPSNGNVLFGTQLRVKVPPLTSFTCYPFESPTSSNGVGIKTPNSLVLPTGSQSSEIYTEDSPRVVSTGVLSLSEMELSEEYTCVISHGSNPRTTHIFDNCIVKSHCSLPGRPPSISGNFLSFCYTCKKHLEHTKDIFIYRGEKAFCSHECRCQEMMVDGVENLESDVYHHS